uniref:Uncharacterized protein n=1 Tax=Chenopodium quinoa TaxID=63459 RepID=A0A803LWP1_CHEQI
MVNACVEHDDFFDALEEISSESSCVSGSDCSESCASEIHQASNNSFSSLHYDFWSGNPKSIDERRDDFIRTTGFVLDRCQTAREGPDDTCVITAKTDRTAGANKHDKGKGLACRNHEAVNEEDQDVLCRIRCLEDGREFESEETDDEGMPRKLHEVGSSSCYTTDEFQETYGSSNLVEDFMTAESSKGCNKVFKRKLQCKEGCLKRFSFKAANMFNKDKEKNEVFHNRELFGSRSQRIHVHSHKKWSKELSSMYHMQEFSAHKGSILCMKFSLDGQYLATGGEYGALNVWKIVEEGWMTVSDHLNFSIASAGLKFSVNGIPKLACFMKCKEDGNVKNKLKKCADSASNGIMVPRKVFRILEKPWHEFRGHEGEIPDISWSKNGHLLSSSVDKTVRLWKMGYSRCLKVFHHNDFVTCAQFNPANNNYFISGSIDGKVRIWDVLRCQVVDWIDMKEIVTAVCYRPDGKFSPTDPSEVVVSSNDSLVRILRGADTICKLRGCVPLMDRRSKVFASFTADGKHVISATDDANAYIWNHISDERTANSKPKNIWSSESFSSPNALIAVPWHGFTSNSDISSPTTRQPSTPRHNQKSSVSRANYCSVKKDKGSSTPAIGDIDYEFLRNVCERILSGSHMWGLVIVTGVKGDVKILQSPGAALLDSPLDCWKPDAPENHE